MPIYDYVCRKCGARFDILHKTREIEEDVVCPACGSKEHRRLMSVSAISMGGRSDPAPRCEGPSCGCSGGSCNLD